MRQIIKNLLHILLVLVPMGSIIDAQAQQPDECNEAVSQRKDTWFQQLRQANFNINDNRIQYPKFLDFCRKVYNWGDRVFNSYDTTYVRGTGHNWKVYLHSHNWHQTYAYKFRGKPLVLSTDLNSDIDLNLNFMAVGIGYTWNINKLISGNNNDNKTFSISFTCARFYAEFVSTKSEGDTYIRYAGNTDLADYTNHRIDKRNHISKMFNLYYFFNNRKFSHAAAYCYSKYQLRSCGSWIAGISLENHKIEMDFSKIISQNDIVNSDISVIKYHKYNHMDFTLSGGYSYNLAMPHNWLYNITILPTLGYKHTEIYEDNRIPSDNGEHSLSLNCHSKMSLTYNHKSLFASAVLRVDGGYYFANGYTFVNSMENGSIIIGFRF